MSVVKIDLSKLEIGRGSEVYLTEEPVIVEVESETGEFTENGINTLNENATLIGQSLINRADYEFEKYREEAPADMLIFSSSAYDRALSGSATCTMQMFNVNDLGDFIEMIDSDNTSELSDEEQLEVVKKTYFAYQKAADSRIDIPDSIDGLCADVLSTFEVVDKKIESQRMLFYISFNYETHAGSGQYVVVPSEYGSFDVAELDDSELIDYMEENCLDEAFDSWALDLGIFSEEFGEIMGVSSAFEFYRSLPSFSVAIDATDFEFGYCKNAPAVVAFHSSDIKMLIQNGECVVSES